MMIMMIRWMMTRNVDKNLDKNVDVDMDEDVTEVPKSKIPQMHR